MERVSPYVHEVRMAARVKKMWLKIAVGGSCLLVSYIYKK